jgi:predicted aspartyl protease
MNKQPFLTLIIFLILGINCGHCANLPLSPDNEVFPLSVSIERGKYFATNVSINGSLVDGKFLIDTGSETMVTDDIARKTGIAGRKEKEITDGYENASVKIGKADFSIDGVSFNKVRVNIIENYDLGMGIFDNVFGIIGHDLMKNCGWKFTNEYVHILPDIKKKDVFSGFVFARLDLQARSIPYFVASFAKPRFTCLMDTGDDGFLEISELLKNHIPNGMTRRGWGSAVTMLLSKQKADNTSVYEIIKTDSMEIAGYVVKQPVAYVTNNDEGASMGSQLFNYFDVIMDFPNKRMLLKQVKDMYDVQIWEIFGFSIEVKQEGVFVQFVWEYSPAWVEGIRPGNRVLSINSSNYRELTGVSSSKIYSEFEKARKQLEMQVTLKNEKGGHAELILYKKQLFSE